MASTETIFPALLRRYHHSSKDLLNSLVMVFPLLVLYHLGLFFTGGIRNGVDFLSDLLLFLGSGDPWLYLTVHLLLVLTMVGALFWLRRRRYFALRCWPYLVLESLIYALFFGNAVLLLMGTFHPGLALSTGYHPSGFLEVMVLSLGAGVFEELVFRLFLFSGGVWLLGRFGSWPAWLSIPVMLLVSSLLFSALHHVGPLGDPFSPEIFAFRFFAGLLLGLLFWTRGLAAAVYTHFLYDLLVML